MLGWFDDIAILEVEKFRETVVDTMEEKVGHGELADYTLTHTTFLLPLSRRESQADLRQLDKDGGRGSEMLTIIWMLWVPSALFAVLQSECKLMWVSMNPLMIPKRA